MVDQIKSNINVDSSTGLDGHGKGRQTTPLVADLPDDRKFRELWAPFAHRLARAQRKRRAMRGTPDATVRHLALQKLRLPWRMDERIATRRRGLHKVHSLMTAGTTMDRADRFWDAPTKEIPMCEHLFDTAKTSSPTAARSTFCPSTSTTIRPPSEFFTSSTVTPVDRTAATRKEGRRVVMVVMVVFV